jgi:hypothetical protein
MRPKGWRLTPAWVEHYSKIDRERIEREIQRVKCEIDALMEKARQDADRQEAVRYLHEPPEDIKEFWRGDGWHDRNVWKR